MLTKRRLTTVVAADICGFSRLAETNEDAAVKTVALVFAAFEQVVTRHQGRVFNRAGDGFLAEFPSAADGVRAAIAFVDDIKARDTLSPNAPAAKVRVGVHVGDVVGQSNGDLLGHGVNVAVRLQSEAEPNGVLASLHAVNLVRNVVDADFRRRGPIALKNINELVVALEVDTHRNPVFNFTTTVNKLRRARLGMIAIAVSVIIGILLLLTRPDLSTEKLSSQFETIEARLTEMSDAERTAARAESQEATIRHILQQLARADLASEDFVVALAQTGSPMDAVDLLYAEYNKNYQQLSPKRRIELLHQVGIPVFASDPRKALSVFNQILAIDPDDVEANIRISRIYVNLDQLKKARAHVERVYNDQEASQDQRLRAADRIGAVILASRDYPAAETWLQKVSNEAESAGNELVFSSSTNRLAIAQQRVGEYDKAKANLLRIVPIQNRLELRDHQTSSFQELAEIAEYEGDYTLAEEYLSKVIEFQKGDHGILAKIDVLDTLGSLAFKQGKYADAEGRFVEGAFLAMENDMMSEYSDLLMGLASIDQALGDKPAACKHISEALTAFPKTKRKSQRMVSTIASIAC
ncbi:MAG: adenylate/guanylate cyclase domain-containing protein [Pseudomonadota bacterium]